MSVGFTPGTDFETITDGLQAVTLDRRNAANTSVTNALQRAVGTSEAAASNGKYTAEDVRWHLPIAECATRPDPGDRILDGGGDYWTVLAVREATLSRRWACICRNVEVVNHLDTTLTIEKATWAKGTGGAMEASYSVWRVVRGRIQPLTADIVDEQGAARTAIGYRIYIGEDLAITQDHRVKDPAGNYYRIDGYTRSEDIGGLQTIDASEWRA
jgi:hypothetical protein